MPTDFTIWQGTTLRLTFQGLDANDAPYNYTDKVIRVVVKATPTGPPVWPEYTLTVDEVGAAVSAPTNRMWLGRPDPADLTGPLIDTAATTGWITVRFAAKDTRVAAKKYTWEAQAEMGDPDDPDIYPLASGSITIGESVINEP